MEGLHVVYLGPTVPGTLGFHSGLQEVDWGVRDAERTLRRSQYKWQDDGLRPILGRCAVAHSINSAQRGPPADSWGPYAFATQILAGVTQGEQQELWMTHLLHWSQRGTWGSGRGMANATLTVHQDGPPPLPHSGPKPRFLAFFQGPHFPS